MKFIHGPLMRSRIGCRFLVFLLISMAAGLRANDLGIANIVERSPFIPSTFSPPQTSAPPAQSPRATRQEEYEFRGVFEIDGEYRLLISQARSRSGNWVPVGGKHENIEVQSFDPETETATLFIDGAMREMKLAAMDANPTPQPVSSQQTARPTATTRPSPTSTGPTRRTIRPSQATPSSATATPAATRTNTPPPPAWLQELRERAAERRAATGSVSNPRGNEGAAPSTPPENAPSAGPPSGRPSFNPGSPPSSAPPPPPWIEGQEPPPE